MADEKCHTTTGEDDEWTKLQRMDASTRCWANEGAAIDAPPGRVNVETGSPEDYRGLMTQIDAGQGGHHDQKMMNRNAPTMHAHLGAARYGGTVRGAAEGRRPGRPEGGRPTVEDLLPYVACSPTTSLPTAVYGA